MASEKIVVCDTNIIIEYFKENISVIREMENIGYENLAVSSVTVGEMYFGALNKTELVKIKMRMDKFFSFHLDGKISELFIDLMYEHVLAHKLTLPDALIASTCIANDVELYTLNTRDFKFISKLKLY